MPRRPPRRRQPARRRQRARAQRRPDRLARRRGRRPQYLDRQDRELLAELGGVETYRVNVPALLWKLRWQLTPVYAVVVLFAAGAATHEMDVAWTVAVVVLDGVAYGWWLSRFRVSERVYGAAVGLAVASWLIAASALGPVADPLPRLLVVGALVLGIPWWSHRRIRSRVVAERHVEAWPDVAKAVGLAGSRLTRYVTTHTGWTGSLRLVGGKQHFRDVVAAVPRLESALGTRPGALRVERDPTRADRVTLHIHDADPFTGDEIPHPAVTEQWAPGSRSIRDPIPVGNNADATRAHLALWTPEGGRHCLIGGASRSGKSVFISDVIAGVAACHDAVLLGVDIAKSGRAFAPWADCFEDIATTMPAAKAMLARVKQLIADRAAAGAAAGETDKTEPTAATPAVVVFVDEAAALLGTDDDEVVTLAREVAQAGLGEAVIIVMATQRPALSSLGSGDMRAQFTISACFRMRELRDVRFVIPGADDQLDTSLFRLAGLCYLQDEPDTVPAPLRTFALYRPQDVREVATRLAPGRPRLWAADPKEAPVGAPQTPPGSGHDPGADRPPTGRTERISALLAAEVEEALAGVELPAVPLADLATAHDSSGSTTTDDLDELDQALLKQLRAAPQGRPTSELLDALRTQLGDEAPSRATVVRRLTALRQAGLARRGGKGRASRWHAGD